MSERTLVGHIDVDAGIVMVGDPCYTLPDDASSRMDDWHEMCDRLADDKQVHPGVWTPWADRPNKYGVTHNVAIVLSTFYGDGTYPVYVEYEDAGWDKPYMRPARVIIDFNPLYEEEE